MNERIKRKLAEEIFEEIKPSNPHGPQSDLYFGMQYCNYENKQAVRIAERIMSQFDVAEKAEVS